MVTMCGTCSICGVDFSIVPAAVCICCEFCGLGVCVECTGYADSIYCSTCRNRLNGYEEKEEEYEAVNE